MVLEVDRVVQPQDVAEVLGGERLLGRRIHGLHDLKETVAEGIPLVAVVNVISSISQRKRETVRQLASTLFQQPNRKRPEEWQLVNSGKLPAASGSNLKGKTKRVDLAESERTERLARVYALALRAFEDEDDAREFMLKPLKKLDNNVPVENLSTELGAREVENILNAVIYGLPY